MTAAPRWIAAALGVGLLAGSAAAKPKPDAAPADDDAAVEDDDDRPAKKKAKDDDDRGPLQKQDLNGHDLGTSKKANVFERDRFFVDKVDSAKTEKATLVQGSVTSTSFAYHEGGDTLAPAGAGVPSASPFNRLYTDLRLQTDFRHIAASRWDGRVDVRGRVVSTPGNQTTDGYQPATPTSSQAGLLGKNELEVKELWLVRNGARSDVFIGRQFVPDLGGLKIDGVRVDYASSAKFTLLGFGGLYPLRGSRSITSDYPELKTVDAAGTQSGAGRFVGAGGFGAAYRTTAAYGSFGGVVLAPLSSESPRIFGTSTGYWRTSNQLDFYHFVILDLVGSNTANAGLTNLSLGANYKPDQRLRATASFNRVDTETLNVQAQAYLNAPDTGPDATATGANVVQNEAYIARIATNHARASLSAGLGELQRFEITTAASYRFRGDVKLSAPPQAQGRIPVTEVLPASQGVELFGSITDRRSIRDLRLGADLSYMFGVGSNTFQRTSSTVFRGYAGHTLGPRGEGEWEAEVAYASSKGDNVGKACTSIPTCLATSSSSTLSIGGTAYYRINRDLFAMGTLFINRSSVTHTDMTTTTNDPAVLGLSGLLRASYRF